MIELKKMSYDTKIALKAKVTYIHTYILTYTRGSKVTKEM